MANTSNCYHPEFSTSNRQFVCYKGHEIETYLSRCVKCGFTEYGIDVDYGECCEGGFKTRSEALARAKEHVNYLED